MPNDAHGEDFDEARDLMDKCGIDLNNYRNGVYVPGYRSDQGNCQGGYNHKSLHTKEYAEELLDKLKEGYGKDEDCDGLKKALQKFKEKLSHGNGNFEPDS
ncbi:hypothetical protein HER14_16470 [Acidithiobacillus thiooxidans]|nr:hypothetical protein [Acidithiobacillus thiooxidans]